MLKSTICNQSKLHFCRHCLTMTHNTNHHTFPTSDKAADTSISQLQAVSYWSSVSADNDGMLGGFPQISKIDLQGSRNFIAKLRRTQGPQAEQNPQSRRLKRAVDCGAGIGRVAAGVLCPVADVVDIVEPVEKFTQEISSGAEFAALRAERRIGDVLTLGLESWDPPQDGRYDLMWHQWCLCQLRDEQVVDYLRKCRAGLAKGGWVIAKENMSTDTSGEDIYDERDSSVTRTDGKFRALFDRADFRIVATELQKGYPRSLFPLRTYALQPKEVP